jgi:hypothetical protein
MALAAAYLFIRYRIGGAREFDPSQVSIYSVVAVLAAITGLGIALAAAYEPTKLWFKTNKCYDRLVWVKGAGKKFLNTLPRLKDQSDAQKTCARIDRDGGKATLTAEELIRRARLAGLDDEE